MGNEDLSAVLLEKFSAEQDKYREWLLSQPPEEILNHTYEYTVREDILCTVENGEFPEKMVAAQIVIISHIRQFPPFWRFFCKVCKSKFLRPMRLLQAKTWKRRRLPFHAAFLLCLLLFA